ncbi:Ribonuclease H domain [Dillenia turbinata]|uniref:Ribonuclease H domain n=1 Tax=Dillenia turbinata TaxID=194707 RepID=A0AAN8VXB4_9MAGN
MSGAKGLISGTSHIVSSKYVATLWIIWKARCKRIFQKESLSPLYVARWALNFWREFNHAVKKDSRMCRAKELWEKGLGMCSATAVELWGVKQGLQLAIKNGLNDVELEVDSLVVLNLLKDDRNSDHPLSAFIRCCQSLMVAVNVVEFHHTFRDGNRCADLLASLGHDCSPGLLEFHSPPSPLCSLLRDDARGVKVFRSNPRDSVVAPRGVGLPL